MRGPGSRPPAIGREGPTPPDRGSFWARRLGRAGPAREPQPAFTTCPQYSVRAGRIDDFSQGLDSPRLDAPPPRSPPADAPLGHALSTSSCPREPGPLPTGRRARRGAGRRSEATLASVLRPLISVRPRMQADAAKVGAGGIDTGIVDVDQDGRLSARRLPVPAQAPRGAGRSRGQSGRSARPSCPSR